jgi:drug/metabolite transporter (DMT)-like permease
MLNKHRGEIYVVLGAIFFSLSGVIVTLVLDHMTAFRLAQIRALGAFAFLFIITFIQDRGSLKAERRELPTLIFYGVVGFAAVQLGYFVSISRGIPLGLVSILEFTAPVWIVLWIKFVRRGFVARDMWVAVALCMAGLILVSQAWDGFTFDLIGIAGALGSAFALAAYFLMSEKIGKGREPIAMLLIGMSFASLFWLVVLPPWNFPFEVFLMQMDMGGIAAGISIPGWLLITYVVILGTVVPYLCVLSGMRLLSASTSSVIGMLEPVIAGGFAWIWFGQSWSFIQLLGAATVLIGIYLADRAKNVTAKIN